MINRIGVTLENENKLGGFLRNCRTRLDPVALGFASGRRRTSGLRREEVAQRANISPTWYTWLEQGRGGAPSEDVLNRIAAGLMLTESEREHLFILGLGRPPAARYRATDTVTPRLQRVLDALTTSPTIIKTATWDVIAWNDAAAALLTDYSKIPREKRNILRIMFGNAHVRNAQDDWRNVARFVVGAFRADVARAGAHAEITQLVEDLSRTSPEFEALWQETGVASHGEGVKRIHHPDIGMIELEFSNFAIDGRPDLGMIVYNPATSDSADRIRALIVERDRRSRAEV
ncbi:putative transcriptional regulator [Acetobacter nitrogenifigens DSM 23921 = NBRC 105050]|uniref:Transcriptional regulator n=1 Tax=Acetobacter nitrogenifigens DSM 23921 = NBRC 105050 TaxID=1120919 RepID=A0A511XCX9_9PROT|nr:helix-turn-helix transcriptional regulator [Acetobacter nitrogenifigens]GBQ91603.1 putative transcriptional regulator [Acetobacter nitrogenifigens DSM 23921 = NBRC 105050]GEN60819.1 transcriptional regulator [Acetobacter nitrogenifigens DSM 23921 = NBRC 105050]